MKAVWLDFSSASWNSTYPARPQSRSLHWKSRCRVLLRCPQDNQQHRLLPPCSPDQTPAGQKLFCSFCFLSVDLCNSVSRSTRHSVNQVEEITVVIKQYVLERFEREYNLLIELPGVSAIVACVILSEIGPNVEAFKSQGNLASWAGVCPGSYESAGIKKSSHTTQGNKYLKSILFQAGGTAGRSKDEAFHNLYARISGRSSKMKAIIACAHKMIRVIYKILSTGEHYDAKKALGLRQQARAN